MEELKMFKTKNIISLMIIILLLVVCNSAIAADVGLFYSQGELDTVGIKIDSKLNNNYLIKLSGESGNLFSKNDEGIIMEGYLYKNIKNKKDFNYYLGAGYKYSYNQHSNIIDGGKLNKNVLIISMKGLNKKGNFNIYGEIGYIPFGKYKYMDENRKDLTGSVINIGIKTMINDNIMIFFEGNILNENYNNFSNNTTGFKIGTGCDI